MTTPDNLSETAYAKINLALHVRRRLTDGYHAIETLFAFVDDGDRLTASSLDEISLEINGSYGTVLKSDEADNLVLLAARAMKEQFAPGRGAAITLDKRLPVASGIGGGSADAGAAIRLLDRLWGLNRPLTDYEALAASIGADVPACLHNRTAIGTSRGDVLRYVEVEGLADKSVLLANPGVALSTADVFRGWDGEDGGSLPHGGLTTLFERGRQDLEAPAIALAPAIGELLEALGEHSPFVRMSGSGATCFALFDSDDDAMTASHALADRLPALWTMAGRVKHTACAATDASPEDAPP